MTELMELLKKRKSTRCFDEDRAISPEKLELCAEAARLAPSACNSQPWKFIIINDPEILDQINIKVLTGIYQMNAFAQKAPAFIALCSGKSKIAARLGGMIKGTDYKSIDIGISCENIVLQAEELGIASCVLGWFNEKKLKKILKVPFTKKIELLIALGYPEKIELPAKIRKNRSEVISLNSY